MYFFIVGTSSSPIPLVAIRMAFSAMAAAVFPFPLVDDFAACCKSSPPSIPAAINSVSSFPSLIPPKAPNPAPEPPSPPPPRPPELPMCTPMTCLQIIRSLTSSRTSRTRKIKSNRLRMVLIRSMLSEALFRSSYRPNTGLAAANTELRLFSTVVIPALAMDMVCCSMAS